MKTCSLAGSLASIVLAACTHDVVVVEDSTIRLLPAAPSAEAGGAFAIVAQRVGPPVGAIAIDYATADATATAGIDYTASSGTLRWEDGDAADQMIAVGVLDDLMIEGDEAFTIALAGQTPASLVIEDNDRVGDAYALTSSGRLVTFDRMAPGTIRHAVTPSGLAPGEAILGIDVRPRDGKLYALSDGARLYTIEPTTGA